MESAPKNVGNRWRGLILTGLLVVCSPGAYALNPELDVSQYAHTVWRVRDGFTQGAILAIAQTPDGYLWLGTEFGLYRFDGVRAIPWHSPSGPDLPSQHVYCLLVAHDGTLWIGTQGGAASWKDGKLRRYPERDGQSISSFLEDREGTIWSSGKKDFYPPQICAISKTGVHCYGNDGSLNRGGFVASMYEDAKGTVWAIAMDGIWRWRPGPPEFYPLPFGIDETHGITEDDAGNLLLGLAGGIRRFHDGKTEAFRLPGKLQPFTVRTMLDDRDAGLWIAAYHTGLIHVHRGKVDVFRQADGLSSDEVMALYEDRENNLWVATEDGLDRFRNTTVATFSVKEGLSNGQVRSVLADKDGSVWIATPGGLDRWSDGQITTYNHRDGMLNGFSPASLFQDRSRRLWLSTTQEIGYLEGDRFVAVTSTYDGRLLDIAQDSAGDIWMADQRGGLLHLSSGKVVERIPWSSLGHKDFAISLAADPSRGGIWLGFFEGGISYFASGKIQETYSSAKGLGAGSVTDLQVEKDGALWAATDSGLSRMKNGRFATLDRENGLPCDPIHWMIRDDESSFWLYTPCGLLRLARSEIDAWTLAVDSGRATNLVLHPKVFDNYDGVAVHEQAYRPYNPPITTSRDGRIWFVPFDGVSVIDPGHLPFNKVPPPVHIQRISADGNSYNASDGLRLPPVVRDLTIDYTALSLAVPQKVRFRYKLERQDPDWKEVVNEREVRYTNLSPGHYTFHVIACNNDGVWNEMGASLHFSIAPAYYQTNWFRAICAAVFLALVWGAYRLRIRQFRRQEEKLRDVIETMPTFAWTALADGYVDFVNRNWHEYSGLSTEKTVGSGWEAAVHPEDLERHSDGWRASLASGRPFESEVRYRRAVDGQYRWFVTRAVPLRDGRGKVIKWYGISTDIQDRKRAEEGLRRSESYLAQAQRLAHMGSWAWQSPGKNPLHLSAEWYRILGFDPKEGMPTLEQRLQRIHPEDRARWQATIDRAIAEKSGYDVEYRILPPDAPPRVIHSVGQPVLDPSGELLQFVGVTMDITESRLAAEERERLRQELAHLAHLNRVSTLAELTASLAHEIKQPIGATVTNAEACLRLLDRDQPDLPEAREAALEMVRDARRVADTIERVRLLYQKGSSHLDVVDVTEVIGDMVIMLQNEANRHSVAIRIDVAEGLPKVMVDRVQLQQVLMNLMLNGIEAMRDTNGELSIKSQLAEDGQLLISVSDMGVGLHSENIERIFDAFFTTKSHGTGLGLAISRSIVESHGGRIWATENSGPGATFHFTLPGRLALP
jgi:PAS domain S-box-containing protein